MPILFVFSLPSRCRHLLVVALAPARPLDRSLDLARGQSRARPPGLSGQSRDASDAVLHHLTLPRYEQNRRENHGRQAWLADSR